MAHGGGFTKKYERQFEQANGWIICWTHQQRCNVVRRLLACCSQNHKQMLQMNVEHLFTLDFLIRGNNAYPESNFAEVLTPLKRIRHEEELKEHRQKYKYWFVRLPAFLQDAVTGKVSIEDDPSLAPMQRKRRKEMLRKALQSRPEGPIIRPTIHLQTEMDVEKHHQLYAASQAEEMDLLAHLDARMGKGSFDREAIAIAALVPLRSDMNGSGLPGTDRRSMYEGTRAVHDKLWGKALPSSTKKHKRSVTAPSQSLPCISTKRSKVLGTGSSRSHIPEKSNRTTGISSNSLPLISQDMSKPRTSSVSHTSTSKTKRLAVASSPPVDLLSQFKSSRKVPGTLTGSPLDPASTIRQQNDYSSPRLSAPDGDGLASPPCLSVMSERPAGGEGHADLEAESQQQEEEESSGVLEDLELCHPTRLHTPWASLRASRVWDHVQEVESDSKTSLNDTVLPEPPDGAANQFDTIQRVYSAQATKTPVITIKDLSWKSKSLQVLPRRGREFIAMFNSWSDSEKDWFLLHLLQLLDFRELYYIACCLMIYRYRDFVSYLPTDVACEILTYLSPDELRIAGKVCKRWHLLATAPDVWRVKYEELARNTGTLIPLHQQQTGHWLKRSLMIERIVRHWQKPLIQYSRMKVHRKRIQAFVLDENRGLAATACFDGSIAVLDVRIPFKLQVLCRLVAKENANCWSIAFFGQQLLLAGYSDGCVRVWSLIEHAVIRTINLRAGTVYCLQICNSLMIAGCWNYHAYLVDLRRPNDIAMIFSGHTSEVYAAQFDDKATTLFTGSRDGTICEWQMTTGKCLRKLKLEQAVLGMSYDQGILAVCSSGDAFLLDCSKPWKKRGAFQGHMRRIEDVSYLRGPHPLGASVLVTAGKDSTVTIHNCSKPGKPLKQLFTHRYASVVAVKVTTTAVYAACGSRLYIWRFDGPGALSF